MWGPRSLLLASLALGGCKALQPAGSSTAPAVLVDAPRRANNATLFLAMPPSGPFLEVRRTLVSEVQRSFDVVTFAVTEETTAAELAAAIAKASPTCLVLMNNRTLRLYDELRAGGAGAANHPVILVMTSFVDELRDRLPNATGIAYEVPGVSAFVSLRTVVPHNVSRVGVIYRAPFRAFFERQRALAAKEQIDLVGIQVGRDPSPAQIGQALFQLGEMKIDALWVLNDNHLLGDGRLRQRVWRPAAERLAVPVIVGARNLIDPETPFGTFSVLPDHEALGVQTANLVFEVAEEDWKASAHPVELPLSTITSADLKQLRARFGLRSDAMERIDHAVE